MRSKKITPKEIWQIFAVNYRISAKMTSSAMKLLQKNQRFQVPACLANSQLSWEPLSGFRAKSPLGGFLKLVIPHVSKPPTVEPVCILSEASTKPLEASEHPMMQHRLPASSEHITPGSSPTRTDHSFTTLCYTALEGPVWKLLAWYVPVRHIPIPFVPVWYDPIHYFTKILCLPTFHPWKSCGGKNVCSLIVTSPYVSYPMGKSTFLNFLFLVFFKEKLKNTK